MMSRVKRTRTTVLLAPMALTASLALAGCGGTGMSEGVVIDGTGYSVEEVQETAQQLTQVSTEQIDVQGAIYEAGVVPVLDQIFAGSPYEATESDIRSTLAEAGLEEEASDLTVEAGRFRADLYYRLNIIPMVLPPLRERRGDVPYLVDHFLKTISRDLGRPAPELDPAVLELFDRHPWKGNVRELESAIHRALVLSSDDRLTAADFSWIALKSGDPGEVADAAVAGAAVPDLADGGYERALNRYDRRLIEAALDESDGRIRETARLLGIARNTLKAKMERYDIDR